MSRWNSKVFDEPDSHMTWRTLAVSCAIGAGMWAAIIVGSMYLLRVWT